MDDPKLSSKTEDVESNEEDAADDPAVQLEKIRRKLKRDHRKLTIPSTTTIETVIDSYESLLEEERQEKKKQKL